MKKNYEKKIKVKVLQVRIRGPVGSAIIYALIDEGSIVSLLDAAVAEKIEATGGTIPLQLHSVSHMQTIVHNSRNVSFVISSMSSDSHEYTVSGARTVPNLRLPCQSLNEEDLKGHHHSHDVAVQQYREITPQVLIGQDRWDLLIPLEIRAASRNAPVASRTRLGWVVHAE